MQEARKWPRTLECISVDDRRKSVIIEVEDISDGGGWVQTVTVLMFLFLSSLFSGKFPLFVQFR